MRAVGRVDCVGFNAVMIFIARTMITSVDDLWNGIAQTAAGDHGVDPPEEKQLASCEWLLNQMQATTPEDEWDLVSRVERLFHSAWNKSVSATQMLECARWLYPPREDGYMRIVSDEVRLAACDVAESSLRYTDNEIPARAIKVSRRYALGLASYDEMKEASEAARMASFNTNAGTCMAAAMTAARNEVHDVAWNAAWAAQTAATRNLNKAWNDAQKRNSKILRKSLGTPGLMLLMR